MNHPLNEMMTSSMAKFKDMIDVNTVIGDPITTPDGVRSPSAMAAAARIL